MEQRAADPDDCVTVDEVFNVFCRSRRVFSRGTTLVTKRIGFRDVQPRAVAAQTHIYAIDMVVAGKGAPIVSTWSCMEGG